MAQPHRPAHSSARVILAAIVAGAAMLLSASHARSQPQRPHGPVAALDRLLHRLPDDAQTDRAALAALRGCVEASGAPLSEADRDRFERLAGAAESADIRTPDGLAAVEAFLRSTRELMCSRPLPAELLSRRARLALRHHGLRDAWESGRLLTLAADDVDTRETLDALAQAGLDAWGWSEARRAATKRLAIELLREAENTAEQVDNARSQSDLLRRIAEHYAVCGAYEEAFAAAEKTTLLHDHAFALGDIGAALWEAGHQEQARAAFGEAVQAARNAPDFPQLSLSTLVHMQADAGDFDGALVTLEQIKDEARRTSAARSLVRLQSDSGDIAGAMRTADMLDEASSRVFSLADIGRAKASVGDDAGARATFSEALESASAIEEHEERATALAYLGRVQAESGDAKGAKEAFRQAERAADAIDNDTTRSLRLSVVAAQMANSGEVAGALRIADDMDTTRGVFSARRTLSIYRSVAEAMARAGRVGDALALLEPMRELARAEKLDASNDIGSVGEALARAGQTERALPLILQTKNPEQRTVSLARLGYQRWISGDIDGARSAYHLAETSADEISHHINQVCMAANIPAVQAMAGDLTRAAAFAQRLDDPFARSWTLHKVAKHALIWAGVLEEPPSPPF